MKALVDGYAETLEALATWLDNDGKDEWPDGPPPITDWNDSEDVWTSLRAAAKYMRELSAQLKSPPQTTCMMCSCANQLMYVEWPDDCSDRLIVKCASCGQEGEVEAKPEVTRFRLVKGRFDGC